MASKKILQKCKKIKLVITDVDGVLTDGGMYYSAKGEEFKKFNAVDGMAVELLRKQGIKTVFMTKENSQIAKQRGKKVQAAAVFVNIISKEKLLSKICHKFRVNLEEIAYIGDDVNDAKIMKLVGFSATPLNGLYQVKKIADYICKSRGGNGAFREFVDLILSKI
jgi:YrbI family 3-deoxy-D-manno-octulosonate 8-phosphate phosphatase